MHHLFFLVFFIFNSFLMCGGQDELKKLSKWEGKTEASRQKLMDKLQGLLFF